MGAMGGVGRIPYTAIAEYVRTHYDGDVEVLDEMLELLGQMDQVLLDHISDQMEQEQKRRESERQQ